MAGDEHPHRLSYRTARRNKSALSPRKGGETHLRPQHCLDQLCRSLATRQSCCGSRSLPRLSARQRLASTVPPAGPLFCERFDSLAAPFPAYAAHPSRAPPGPAAPCRSSGHSSAPHHSQHPPLLLLASTAALSLRIAAATAAAAAAALTRESLFDACAAATPHLKRDRAQSVHGPGARTRRYLEHAHVGSSATVHLLVSRCRRGLAGPAWLRAGTHATRCCLARMLHLLGSHLRRQRALSAVEQCLAATEQPQRRKANWMTSARNNGACWDA